jgi:hypothetical protein
MPAVLLMKTPAIASTTLAGLESCKFQAVFYGYLAVRVCSRL